MESALDYLIGEKLFTFVGASDQDPEFAEELPAFVAEVQRLFTAGEIGAYLERLERSKFLAPAEPDLEMDDLDEEVEEEPWPDNPVLGAQVSPLLKGEAVEVQGMAPEEACASDMLVLIKWQSRTMAVPLSQL